MRFHVHADQDMPTESAHMTFLLNTQNFALLPKEEVVTWTSMNVQAFPVKMEPHVLSLVQMRMCLYGRILACVSPGLQTRSANTTLSSSMHGSATCSRVMTQGNASLLVEIFNHVAQIAYQPRRHVLS